MGYGLGRDDRMGYAFGRGGTEWLALGRGDTVVKWGKGEAPSTAWHLPEMVRCLPAFPYVGKPREKNPLCPLRGHFPL